MHSSSNVARHLSPHNMPTPPPNLHKSPHRASHPVLRWFGHTNPSHSSMPSPSDSQPPSPSSDPVENLLDALTSPLPALSTPTLKRPPRTVPPNMPLWSSPSHLLGLSRVTLPTASLSNLIPVTRPFDPSDDSQSPGAPIYLQHSPPERSSLDALRSLRNRQSASSARLSRSTSLASLPSLPSLFSTSATPSWWRFQNDNKEDIDQLLSEEDRAPTVEEERSRIRKKCAWHSIPLPSVSSHLVRLDLSPKHPIVFCHGLLGFDSVTIGPAIAPLEVTHWRGIKEVLQANGTEVLVTRVPATSSPIQRAKVLEQKIEETYPGRSVHLLGTSLPSHSSHALTFIKGIVW